MITGERRGVRRGMTVLGKLPAVPRPLNLPSQRLENRGLDPNVELVPRGTVTWGTTGRSPPSSSNWGSGSQPSSPPVSSGPWGTKPGSGGGAWAPNSARPSSAGSTRPASSGGSSSGAPRPSSSGGGRLPQDLPRPSSAGNQEPPPQNAWGPGNRPSSASGLQIAGQAPPGRPRSAESRPNGPVSLLTSELAHAGPPAQPWGPPASRRPPEEGASRFTFSTGDFPSLGSEKNPNLRPQQRDRSDHVDDRSDERPPTSFSDSYQYDEGYPQGSRFNDAEAPNVWARGPGPFRGPPGMEGGYGMPSNSWRREPPPHEHPEGDDHWPPNGPYAGPPRFPNPEFLPQRFGPPGSFGRGGHGQPGDGYGPPPFMRPMNPERPPQFGPGMFPGPYEGYYGYPGYNMDWGGGPGYGGFHPDFPRHPMGPRPRHMPNHTGFGKDAEGFHSDFRAGGGKMKEGENAGPRGEGQHPEFRRENKHASNEPKRPMHPRPHGQRDWGNEEPMDFSRPVFDKEPGNPPVKNHKVSFKAEPTVADVAILKKPQPVKPKQEEDGTSDVPRVEEITKVEAATVQKDIPHAIEKDVAEEKAVTESSAGVLGKAPPPPVVDNEKQGSPLANRSVTEGARHSTEANQQGLKEGLKSKPKVAAHESEKEWRPKLQAADSKGDGFKPSSAQDTGDIENMTEIVYDYEAQRAKMKEIAAQRARQLQKEEEERTKEQKAKALAKLEELNRRSAVGSNESSAPVIPEEKNEALQRDSDQSTEVQFGTYQAVDLPPQDAKPVSVPVKRNDRRGNRNRDERAKVQPKKEQNAGPSVSAEEELQVLPSLTQEEVQDQQQSQSSQSQPLPHKQPRQRGGQRTKQSHAKQLAKLEAGKLDTPVEQVESLRPADASVESDSPGATVSTAEGNGPVPHRRKKMSRNPRNRHKNEAAASSSLPTPCLEKSSSGEIQEPGPGQPELPKVPERVGHAEISSHSEGGESTTVEPSDSVVLPDERGSSRGNNSKRFQRKFPSRRPSKPQDVRVSDKSHAAEGLRWAPVRNSSGGPRNNDTSPDYNNGEKNEGSSPHQQHKSRRAEIERYTPKPVKQQGQAEDNYDQSHGKQARGGNDGGQEAFHKPGRAWRQRPGENSAFRNQGGGGHDKRENGMIYQQKSGGGRQFQDVVSQEKAGEGHQRFHYQQQPAAAGSMSGSGGHAAYKQQQQQHFQADAHHHPKNHGSSSSDSWSTKADHGNSQGEGMKEFRAGRDSRRGRFGGGGGRGGGGSGGGGGGGGARTVVDMAGRADKQRMVIDATGGAVPSQVVG